MALSLKKASAKGGRNTGLQGGRLKRTVVALGLITALGVALALLNAFTTRRDLALATGPEGPEQRAWLVAAADRPDIAGFFKGLPHDRRVAMAKAIARYDDAPLAKLSGILLADFDAEARAALVVGLKRVAAVHPEAVADGLKQKGSFQQLGVFEALRSGGARSIPGVVAMLENGDARPAAVAYLVATGPPAVAPLLPRLAHPTLEVRLAAAEALGALRAREAIPPLLKNLDEAAVADRPAYLAAIAAIGDPSTEPLLASILRDLARPLAERAAVVLGLGRIADPDAVRLLWGFAPSEEPVLARAALAALSVVGPTALKAVPLSGSPLPSGGEGVGVRGPKTSSILGNTQEGSETAKRQSSIASDLVVKVASTLRGPEADAALGDVLMRPRTRLLAAAAAAGRSRLVPALAALIPLAQSDGELASALVGALASTEPGRAALDPHRDDPALEGFIRRSRT